MSRKSKDWFLERVGNRVYRDDNGCEHHASYLYDIQNELNVNYYDSKKEKNESSS